MISSSPDKAHSAPSAGSPNATAAASYSTADPNASLDLAQRIEKANRLQQQFGADPAQQTPTLPSATGQNAPSTATLIGFAAPAPAANAVTNAPAPSAGAVLTSSASERASVVTQLAGHVSALSSDSTVNGTTQQMTVKIHPEQWGEVKIAVTVQAPQDLPRSASQALPSVTATITAASEDVRAALNAQHDSLRDALGSAGLHLEKLDIVVGPQTAPVASSQDTGAFHQGHQSGQNPYASQQGMTGGFAQPGSDNGQRFSSYGQSGSANSSSQARTDNPTAQTAQAPTASAAAATRGRVDYRI
jgi:flagellar hook-length control protein FliK